MIHRPVAASLPRHLTVAVVVPLLAPPPVITNEREDRCLSERFAEAAGESLLVLPHPRAEERIEKVHIHAAHEWRTRFAQDAL